MNFLKYIIVILLFAGCSNKEVIQPDYEYKSVYFPLQYPLRTLVLGDSRSDNSIDKKHQFNIGIGIGGLYENKQSWDVSYTVDKSLVPASLSKDDGTPLEVLPDSYYTLAPSKNVTIPAGSFNGLILVQLTDAFFNDPFTVGSRYVIPLRITGTSADSILKGVPAVPNPNKNILSDWDANALPKDYVLFGIKYINPFHGTYLHRGKDNTLNSTGGVVSTVTYHQKYVEEDQLWNLATTGKTTVASNGVGSQFTAATAMTFDINAEGNIQISPVTSSPYKATGTGKYVKDAEAWGGLNHHAMYLNYTYKDGAVSHQVLDTLVFRDNGVVFEELKVRVN